METFAEWFAVNASNIEILGTLKTIVNIKQFASYI